MLPDHALHASSAFADHHARAGSNGMEVARRERCGALLRSTRARCGTGQRTDIQFVYLATGQQFRKQQFEQAGCRSSQLHERRDLETQQGNDHLQLGRPGRCGRTRRASIGQWTSPGVIYGRQAGFGVSRKWYGVRDVGSGARCAHSGADDRRCTGQTRHRERARRVFCSAGFGTESSPALALTTRPVSINETVAVDQSHLSVCCMQSLRLQGLQSERAVSVLLQGSIFSW